MHEQLSYQPRKLPQQARSILTVEAILQATLELIKKNDCRDANTTRIALRAGVSVGTLYQYFPNKSALWFAALQWNLEGLSTVLEELCARNRGKTLATLAHDFAAGWVDLKIARVADRLTLQDHMAELGMGLAKMAVFNRTEQALTELLVSVPDIEFSDVSEVAVALLGEMHAVTWPALLHCSDPTKLARLRHRLLSLVQHHLGARPCSLQMRIA